LQKLIDVFDRVGEMNWHSQGFGLWNYDGPHTRLGEFIKSTEDEGVASGRKGFVWDMTIITKSNNTFRVS